MNTKESGTQKEEQFDKSLFGSLNDVKKVIAVLSGKGGVGKSTVSCLLATHLRRMGYSTAILDADITGPSIPRAFGLGGIRPEVSQFGIEPPLTKSGIKVVSINFFLPQEDDPVIWRGPLLAGGVKQFWEETDWQEVDYLVVDLPPGTGDIPLTVLQSLPVSGVLTVTSPQDLAAMVVKKSIKMARMVGTQVIGLIENMSQVICPCCGSTIELFGSEGVRRIAEETGIPLLGRLPFDPRLNEAMDKGFIEDFDMPEFGEITSRLLELLEK